MRQTPARTRKSGRSAGSWAHCDRSAYRGSRTRSRPSRSLDVKNEQIDIDMARSVARRLRKELSAIELAVDDLREAVNLLERTADVLWEAADGRPVRDLPA